LKFALEKVALGVIRLWQLSLAFGAEVLDYFLVLISICLLRKPPLFPAGHFMYAGSSSRCFLVADSKDTISEPCLLFRRVGARNLAFERRLSLVAIPGGRVGSGS
jgi:hypothetical protein